MTGRFSDAMQALLEQWGIRVYKAHGSSEALQLIDPKSSMPCWRIIISAMQHRTELIKRITESAARVCAAALITADHGAELTRAARRESVPLLHKPLRPAALRALLSAFKLRLTRGSAA